MKRRQKQHQNERAYENMLGERKVFKDYEKTIFFLFMLSWDTYVFLSRDFRCFHPPEDDVAEKAEPSESEWREAWSRRKINIRSDFSLHPQHMILVGESS